MFWGPYVTTQPSLSTKKRVLVNITKVDTDVSDGSIISKAAAHIHAVVAGGSQGASG